MVLKCGDQKHRPQIVSGVPVCNERERIVACIDALATTLSQYPHTGVVLLVNNSSDSSCDTAHCALNERGMTGIVLDTLLAPSMATAGWARRLALDVAARWAAKDAVLMTTDADGRVAHDWAEANLAMLAEGAHLVCGRIAPDAVEAALLPASIAPSDTLESAYTKLSIELDALLDPRAHDPWPHHGLASGASLAFSVADYLAVGRMQPQDCSEDRAFAARVERHDLRVRHSDAPMVTVSCRLTGRARGGMADAISARIADTDSLADQRLLPARMTAHRARTRAALRAAWLNKSDMALLMGPLGVAVTRLQRALRAKTFGAFWEDIECGAPSLSGRRMRPSDLSRELLELSELVIQARAAR